MDGDVVGSILLPVFGLKTIFYVFIIIFIGVVLFMFYRMVRVCSSGKKSQQEMLNNCLYNKKYVKQDRDTTLSELNDAIGLKLSRQEHKFGIKGKSR
jgi:hypothetical protein